MRPVARLPLPPPEFVDNGAALEGLSGYRVPMKTIIACTVVLLLAGCGGSVGNGDTNNNGNSNSKKLKQSDFGDEWPLTVDAGTVSCENGGQVLFKVGKTTYAVNGTATMQRKELPEISKIWADNPDPAMGKEAKINIGPILDTGLKLCE